MSTEHTLAENLLRLQSATEDIADAITEKGGTASYSDGLEAMGDKIRAIPNPQPVLTTKTIIQNGTYRAEDDDADGYSEVSVDVSNSYTAQDEGKVVSNGALVAQGSDTVTENGTVDTTLIGSLTVNVESGGEIPKQKGTKPALSGREVYSSSWTSKSWSGLSSFNGQYIWTDGDNIYYSNGSSQYVLNKSTSTWSSKSWSGTSPDGGCIWTDGDNIYYSNNDTQYVLNKATSRWTAKTWSGLTSFYGSSVWTDGDNIYYSYYRVQYVLDKSKSTWSSKSWSGMTTFYGDSIWTDSDNIYYSDGSTQRVLNKQPKPTTTTLTTSVKPNFNP